MILLTFDSSNAGQVVPPYQRPGFKIPIPRKYTPPGKARHLYSVTSNGMLVETVECSNPVSAELKRHVEGCLGEDRPHLALPIKLRKANKTERDIYISAHPTKPDFSKRAAA